LPEVDIRWRPSGGRGEYEHVPQEILLGRKIVINTISVPGAYIATDVWGRIRDGKPRLRREKPNDHSILNVAPLVAALALLPDSRRDDPGKLILPLRSKGYVISSIRFSVEHADDNRAICTPLSLHILHDSDTIDLVERLTRVKALLSTPGMPGQMLALADSYRKIVQAGLPTAVLTDVAEKLSAQVNNQPEIAEALEAPSDLFVPSGPAPLVIQPDLSQLTAVETARKLVSHYRIERSSKIRDAKVKLFAEQNGKILCENCEFSFESRYGERGKGFIEVHHIQPLAALLPNVITKLTDLMLLCSNCHRMVHRKQPQLSPAALKNTTHL
jgi:hypothetical protein